jgi:hypothetical protein
MRRLPGQTSTFALLMSGSWAILGLFIIIIGHLVWAFIAYGFFTSSDALADLERFLPVLQQLHLYILAGLAILADIWVFISHKKARQYKIQR